MSETYTIKHGDPKHLDAKHRVGGKDRAYRVSVKTGDVFTIIPDNPAALPICKLQMKMQRGFFNQHFGSAEPAKPSKANAAKTNTEA